MLKSFTIFSLLSFAAAFPQTKAVSDTVLARVGNSPITRSEFVSRYESNPGFHLQIQSRTQINKEIFLFSLIKERLLAEEAKRQGLEADESYRIAVKDVEDPLVRDQLYRQEVRDKIVNTPEEISEAVAKSRVKLNVYMVYSSDESGAKFLESRIKAGMKLEDFTFVGDTTDQFSGADSMVVHWGEDNEEIEDAAYSLRPGETSEPLRFGDGWYIIKVMGKWVTSGGGQFEEENLKRHAEEILTRRKEGVRMVQYLSSALEDEKSQADGKIFGDLSGAMFNEYMSDTAASHPHDSSDYVLTGKSVDILRASLSSEWNDVFINFPDSNWTLGESVDRLFGQGFGVANPSLMKLKFTLDQALRNLVYQEELTQIGYRNGLGKAHRVQKKLAMWKNFYLANLLTERIADSVKASEREVANYISTMVRDSSHVELVKLKEIILHDPAAVYSVTEILANGGKFDEVSQRFPSDVQFGDRVRTGYHEISELGSIGTMLKDVRVGKYIGPVHTHDGYIFAELLERKELSPLDEDRNVDLNLSIKNKIIADTLKYITDTYVASLAEKFGVVIYADNLAGTRVTSMPMLMFQLLGFGGRMFATPLIVPEAGWVQYWDVTSHLAP